MNEKKPHKIKATNVYLAIMLGFWVWYIWFEYRTYADLQVWLPESLTIGTIILLFYEVFSLLRVRMVKEGIVDEHGIIAGTYSKIKAWANGKSPIELPDTEIDVEIAKEQASARNNQLETEAKQ